MQRLDEVERAIRGYLELHPADLNFLYSLAGCLYAQDRLEEAVKPLQTITLFEPDNPRAHELFKLIEEKQTTLTSVQSGTY